MTVKALQTMVGKMQKGMDRAELESYGEGCQRTVWPGESVLVVLPPTN